MDHEVFAAHKAAYEAKRQELLKSAEAEMQAVEKVRQTLRELKARYKDERRVMNATQNHPTAESITNRRKKEAHKIRRRIGALLADWQCPYLDTDAKENIVFNLDDNKLVFTIRIPFIHSAYEDIHQE